MPNTVNLLSRDDALSIVDDSGNSRDLETFQSLPAWTSTNATISVVSTPYIIPNFYTIKLYANNDNNGM